MFTKEISTARLCSRILQQKNALLHLGGKVVESWGLTFLPWRPGAKLCQKLPSENCRRVCPHRQFCLRGSRAEAGKGGRAEGEPLCWGDTWSGPAPGLGSSAARSGCHSERCTARVTSPGFVGPRQHLWVEAWGLPGQSAAAEVSCLFLAAPQRWLCAQVGPRTGEAPQAG